MAKRVKVIIGVVCIVISLFISLCIYNGAAKQPFSKISESDIAEVSIIYGTHEPQRLSDEEVERFIDILRSVTIYEIDNRYDEWEGGYPGTFWIKMTNGREIYVRECAPFFIINKTGFQAEYTPCDQLGKFFFEMVDKYIKFDF